MLIDRSTTIAFLALNILIIFFYISVGFPNDMIFFATNYLILQLSSAGLLYKPRQYYSLSKFFYMYTFFFFGIVPYLDMVNKIYYWGGGKLDISHFITANIIIIAGLCTYFFAYILSKNNININNSLKKEQLQFDRVQRYMTPIFIILLSISLVASYFIFAKNNFNFMHMLVRGMIENGEIITSSMSQIELLIYGNLITPLPILSLLLYGYISYQTKNIQAKIFFIILFSLVVIFVSPTSISRFLAIALYLSILLNFTHLLEKKYLFQLGSIFGLLIIMPFLDKFRYFNPKTFTMGIDFGFLSGGHFDGYQNFVRLISIDYISYGYQVLGSFLFFVPRSLWPEKPIGSGAQLASMTHLELSNIAMPFIAEGFINFSIFGSLLFMFIIGYYSGKMDNFYWSLRKTTPNHSFFNIYYLSLGMSFFILRGDFLSSFAYTFTIIGTYWIMLYVTKKITTIK